MRDGRVISLLPEEMMSDQSVAHFVHLALLALTFHKIATREPMETSEKAIFVFQGTIVVLVLISWFVSTMG